MLVLDEATSNIDAEAEKSIQEALAVLVRGRTTIAIAHRLSTLRNADRILAFDRGRLAEQGTHAELLAADGIYARLVRIQTQVSRHPTVDSMMLQDEPDPAVRPQGGAAQEHDAAAPSTAVGIQWLGPDDHGFAVGPLDRIELRTSDGSLAAAAVFVVQAFPASQPEAFLSVRSWNESGDEVELGMIRSLEDWPEPDREAVRTAIGRRSLVRTIERVHDVTLAQGYLCFDVETDVGRRQFTTRWTQSQAIDFGGDGKMLIDTDENRYVVRRIDALPEADRERFLHYVYW